MGAPVAADRPRVGRAIGFLPRLLAIHGLCWALYGAVTHWGGVVHTDMLEAWSWGREFQPGYHKHPPVFAWAAGAWFSVLPRTNGFFYGLAALNTTVGLLGIWRLGRLVGDRRAAALGVALFTLTPLPNVLALTFNANAILLSVWPWTALAFLRSLRSGRAGDGALFGAGCAVALLSKYYSVVLLLSCLGGAVAFSGRRDYFRGPAPWTAVATCTALCLPYLAWSLETGAAAVEYALSKTEAPRGVTLGRAVTAAGGALAYFAAAAALLAAARPSWRPAQGSLAGPLLWLALGPFGLTVAAAAIGNVNISTRYLIPAFFAVPAAALAFLRIDARAASRIERVALAAPLVVLGASPLVVAILFGLGVATLREPHRDLAAFATDLVRRETGQALGIVGGSVDEALAIAFYSADAPSDFTSLDAVQAPWITPERLARTGILVVCSGRDADCLRAGQAIERGGTAPVRFEAASRLWGLTGPPAVYTLYVVPPAQAAALPWGDLSLSGRLPAGRLPAGRPPAGRVPPAGGRNPDITTR